MSIVVDASVAMAWCFDDESSSATDAILEGLREHPAVVPSVWNLEVANVLLVAERKGKLTEAAATHFLDLLQRLPITVEAAVADPQALLAIGRRHRLSAYDASYLLLAERLGAPLATLDRPLAAAAQSVGVPLLIRPS